MSKDAEAPPCRNENKADRLLMLVSYRAWANVIAYDGVEAIPVEELLKPRATTFGNILMTLNHIWVVDDIFRHHLEGRRHAYTFRNTEEIPSLAELRRRAGEMDNWLIEQVRGWSEKDRAEVVNFEFVGGGDGAMTRDEIALHLVNHATYHRGFVGDMLKQVPYFWPANDLTVFLRDVWRPRAS